MSLTATYAVNPAPGRKSAFLPLPATWQHLRVSLSATLPVSQPHLHISLPIANISIWN